MARLCLFISVITCFASVTYAANAQNKLPVPRFVSLRAPSAKIHVGPGPNYPVSWLFQRQGMPLEVIAEFDIWRQVRDWQGTEGWIHKSMISGRRYFWVTAGTQELKDAPNSQAKTVARIEKDNIGKLIVCQQEWCKVAIKSTSGSAAGQAFNGWLPRRVIWGTYQSESKF